MTAERQSRCIETKRLIAVTAAIVAFAAPVASARPAGEHTTITASGTEVSEAQWQRAEAIRPTPLTVDARTERGPLPALLVALAAVVALGLAVLRFAGSRS